MWRTGSLLLRGLSHLETDTECQDYVRFDQIGDSTVLVVSDGAVLPPWSGRCKPVADCVSEYILKQADEFASPFQTRDILGIVELGF